MDTHKKDVILQPSFSEATGKPQVMVMNKLESASFNPSLFCWMATLEIVGHQ
jgi:hypothetical protein